MGEVAVLRICLGDWVVVVQRLLLNIDSLLFNFELVELGDKLLLLLLLVVNFFSVSTDDCDVLCGEDGLLCGSRGGDVDSPIA